LGHSQSQCHENDTVAKLATVVLLNIPFHWHEY
jgi:hypothetical protein